MNPAQIQVETDDGIRTFTVALEERHLPLSELLARHGWPLNTRCGGRGRCAGCEVELRPAGPRVRACQFRWTSPEAVTLAVPTRSLLRHQPSIVSEFRIGIPWARDPLHPDARYGAAVDVGTTTVSLLLCDLATGRPVSEASVFNAQIRYGEDVVTRIQHGASNPSALVALQRALAVETIQPLLERAAAAAGIALGEIGVMTVAGNTTMLHLLAGVDPSPMGTHPFRAVFLDHRVVAPRDIGLAFGGSDAALHLLPGAAAYVGADLAAGLVATGMSYQDGPAVLVDVGTNGEIVVKDGDRLLGCATAAGPAFEGAGLSCGMRGVTGAVKHVRLQARPFAAALEVIGGGPHALGLCGSAYVDFLWEARRQNLIGPEGRFTETLRAESGAVMAAPWGRALVLQANGPTGPIGVSEVDIARLLQAKAAIAAGITTLLGLIDRGPADVRTVYLAGGFGLHLSVAHAIGCGLLPGFTESQVRVVGNTSLAGAYLALNDRSLLAEIGRTARGIEVIELNLQPAFEDAYIDHLAL